MPGCAATPCKYGQKPEKIKRQTFPFPEGALKEKWIQQIDRENFTPGEYSRVCEIHFQEKDFAPQKDSRGRDLKKKILKPWAYPTLDLRPLKESKKRPTRNSTEKSENNAKSNVIRLSKLKNDNTKAELGELFSQFGDIEHINLEKNEKNDSQVQGYIHFSNKEDALKAFTEVKELKNVDDTLLKLELLEELDDSGKYL